MGVAEAWEWPKHGSMGVIIDGRRNVAYVSIISRSQGELLAALKESY